MKIIVGLGNPGPKYEFSRHNVGFLLIDLLANNQGFALNNTKFDGLFGKGSFMETPCLLVKPMTFMNRSGVCVRRFLQYFKVETKDLIVVHDDIDLPNGHVRMRLKGGAGGHNGIKSIIAETGRDDFSRIKIGVGRPKREQDHPNSDVSNWVLSSFAPTELEQLRTQVLDDTAQRLQDWL